MRTSHYADSPPPSSAPSPEERLYLAMLGSFLLPTSLFLFGWSAHYRLPWIVPVIAEALFGAGNLVVFMVATLYMVNFYGAVRGASAMAANTMARYVLATALPLVSVQMFEG